MKQIENKYVRYVCRHRKKNLDSIHHRHEFHTRLFCSYEVYGEQEESLLIGLGKPLSSECQIVLVISKALQS